VVNAMLRRYLRERDALNDRVVRDSPVARWSHQRGGSAVQADHPAHWESILVAGNQRPPLTLRVNGAPHSRASARSLARGRRSRRRRSAKRDHRGRAAPVAELPGFADGWISVQDAGAQLAAPLLDLRDGQRVLDAVRRPGGKTAHIAESADVELTALDADPRASRASDENLDRAAPRRTHPCRVGDAGDPARLVGRPPYDRILADVPCTASGTVRRHPDSKWLRRKTDIASFAAQQKRLLHALWPLLAPEAALLYVTCSVFDAENELQ
jgi:16S rRNA (cytosine967-C5)-methyltransferase